MWVMKTIVFIWKWKTHFMISEEKKYRKVHVSSPWCMHAPKVSTKHTQTFFSPKITFMWTSGFYWYGHVYTCRRSFKIFLKENYAIALDSCYLFTKKKLNMELNMILIVLMQTSDVPDIDSRFDEYLAI